MWISGSALKFSWIRNTGCSLEFECGWYRVKAKFESRFQYLLYALIDSMIKRRYLLFSPVDFLAIFVVNTSSRHFSGLRWMARLAFFLSCYLSCRILRCSHSSVPTIQEYSALWATILITRCFFSYTSKAFLLSLLLCFLPNTVPNFILGLCSNQCCGSGTALYPDPHDHKSRKKIINSMF